MSDGSRSYQDCARRLRTLMLALGDNQTAFAARIEVSQPALNNYLKGIRRPRIEEAMRIRARTGVTLDWLYEGDRSGLPDRLLTLLPPLDSDQSVERAG